jgi:hypothetical protein
MAVGEGILTWDSGAALDLAAEVLNGRDDAINTLRQVVVLAGLQDPIEVMIPVTSSSRLILRGLRLR